MAASWRRTTRGATFAILAGTVAVAAACGDADPPPDASPSAANIAAFDGVVQCQPGEEDGAAFWDYGANPRGTIDDPVVWVRESAVGLDPTLTLSFDDRIRVTTDVLENVVLVQDEAGSIVGFVEFGRDDEGRYFPNYAEMCASTGIEEFR